MTPQELRASILQQAIQGKLVEQCPEEGTGEELFQKIQAEKLTMIKAGKIKKEKPLPEIVEDEIPFDIPDTWKWIHLNSAISLLSGSDLQPSKYNAVSKGIPYITGASNIENHQLLINRWTEHPNNIAYKGDLLLTCKGTVGKTIILQEAEVHIARQLMAITPILIDTRYTQFFVECQVESLKAKAKSMIPGIERDNVLKLLLPLPPLAEQKRIVTKLEEVLPLIDRYEAAWNKLEEFNKRFPVDMQKSILQMAIQGKLVPQIPEEGTGEELFQQIQAEKQRSIKAGTIKKEKPLPEITEDEIPFDIPDSWKWVRVAQIVTLNPKNDLDDDLETAFIPMPCVMDGFRNQHTFEIKKWKEIKKGFTHFAEGDIGVAKITPCFQNRKSVIFRDLINGYGAGTTELTVVQTINETVLPEYLLWFFKSEYFIANGVKSFTGTAGQQRIHKDYLATCLVPLPPLAEQKCIVAKLEEILPLCERLK